MRYFLGEVLILIVCVAGVTRGDSAPAGVDEKLWNLMLQIDAQGAKITDLKADFTQEKFTPLLKKPLISTGTISIKGSAALWKTVEPSPTVMRIDAKEASLFF